MILGQQATVADIDKVAARIQHDEAIRQMAETRAVDASHGADTTGISNRRNVTNLALVFGSPEARNGSNQLVGHGVCSLLRRSDRVWAAMHTVSKVTTAVAAGVAYGSTPRMAVVVATACTRGVAVAITVVTPTSASSAVAFCAPTAAPTAAVLCTLGAPVARRVVGARLALPVAIHSALQSGNNGGALAG